jgi:MOSC domain-containing protein YiiM
VGRHRRASAIVNGQSAGRVVAVACDSAHRFAKPVRDAIALVPGHGVVGDVHGGTTVKHRSRLKQTPDAPNLRQVHLIHAELFDELSEEGFAVAPGQLGENVTTLGIDLLALPRGARLRLGDAALVELTGLRNPCRQIDANIGPGAMAATLARAADGSLVRKAGVMGVVVVGGNVRPGDPISVHSLPKVLAALEPV